MSASCELTKITVAGIRGARNHYWSGNYLIGGFYFRQTSNIPGLCGLTLIWD